MLCHPQLSLSWPSSRCQSSGWSMTGRLACTMPQTSWRGCASPSYLPQSWWRGCSLLTSWGVTRCARNYSWMPWTTTWCPSGSTAGRPCPAGEHDTLTHTLTHTHTAGEVDVRWLNASHLLNLNKLHFPLSGGLVLLPVWVRGVRCEVWGPGNETCSGVFLLKTASCQGGGVYSVLHCTHNYKVTLCFSEGKTTLLFPNTSV